VVFVSVGENHCNDVIETVTNGFKVGQNQVDAWLSLLGEQHTAVNNQQLAIEFEDGHVATDFADSPERNNAERSRFESGRFQQRLGHSVLKLAGGPRDLRQCATGGSVTVWSEVSEVNAWHVVNQGDIVLDFGGLGFFRAYQWETNSRRSNTTKSVKDVLGGDGSWNMSHGCPDQGLQEFVLGGGRGKIALRRRFGGP